MLLAVSIDSITVVACEGYRSGRSSIKESVVNQLAALKLAKTSQGFKHYGYFAPPVGQIHTSAKSRQREGI